MVLHMRALLLYAPLTCGVLRCTLSRGTDARPLRMARAPRHISPRSRCH